MAARIGRSLEVVSGGATSSFTLVHWGTMPAGINHLRIGEGILLGFVLLFAVTLHTTDQRRGAIIHRSGSQKAKQILLFISVEVFFYN